VADLPIPEDEWALLANAVAEPVEQLIAVETADSEQLHTVERRLLELAGTRPVLRQAVRPGEERPEAAWRRAKELTAAPSPALPLLLLVVDAWPDSVAQRDELAAFWRGMNQLRENWHDLPAQIVFLLSPAAYEHLTLNADHLKSWIALKVRLWEGARDIAVLARPGASPETRLLSHDTKGFENGASTPLNEWDVPSRNALRSLALQAEEARQRGEEPALLMRRYYLPLIAGYLASGDADAAAAWRSKIERDWKLPADLQNNLQRLEKKMQPSHTGYDVFLSHNSKDKPAVRSLAGQLRDAGLSVWLGEDELRPGLPWQDLLEIGIRDSRSVAVLIGKDGIGPWEDEEMRAALDLAVRDKRPVIPLLLPDAPAAPALPLFLANRTWVDLRPAIDADKLDRLIWGITGVKPGSRHQPGSPSQKQAPSVVSPALAIWREKLDFLLEQQAICADPAQQFQLKKAIEVARQKIAELGG